MKEHRSADDEILKNSIRISPEIDVINVFCFALCHRSGPSCESDLYCDELHPKIVYFCLTHTYFLSDSYIFLSDSHTFWSDSQESPKLAMKTEC